MSLSGIEWSDLAVLSRHLSALISKKNLTEEEKYVTIWLEKQVKKLFIHMVIVSAIKINDTHFKKVMKPA